jgi:hypothetical protein
MSSNPIGRTHVPSWTPQPDITQARPGQPLGQRLFDDITEFYCWYVTSWYRGLPSKEGESIPKILSVMKRVAEVSMNGANYLSEKEEIKAVDSLSNILQDLNSGKLRQQDLPEALMHVTSAMINHNPKAKVVSQTTELEYRLCINPDPAQPSDLTNKYQQTLSMIIEKITPEMRDSNATAIAQGLSQILAHPENFENTHEAIQQAVKDWL